MHVPMLLYVAFYLGERGVKRRKGGGGGGGGHGNFKATFSQGFVNSNLCLKAFVNWTYHVSRMSRVRIPFAGHGRHAVFHISLCVIVRIYHSSP